jgi:ubiquinone/menaquinone biosynthesis C-methylase UbiE
MIHSFKEAAMTVTSGTGQVQGELWGARADDWAEHETQYRPVYDEAVRRLGIGPGTTVLDVGCGSGAFLRAAADHGAGVFGLDASAALLERARSRVPEADLRHGDLQFLPYESDTFDVVTSFNSFWFAADPIEALREAGRVAKPGAPVLVLVWGRPEGCELGPLLAAVGSLFRHDADDAPRDKFELHEPGVLEEMATAAGLTPASAHDLVTTLEFPDDATLVRQLLSPGSIVQAARVAGEHRVHATILESLAPFRRPSGDYRLRNEWHYLIASASA